jgi:predicted HicB family RNase H-like nuclease
LEKATKSIRIDPKLSRRARVRALGEGRMIQDLVAESLRKYLAEKKAGRNAGTTDRPR